MATKNPTAAPGTVAKSMNDANKAQISEALIIQTYANSVEQQPQVSQSTPATVATKVNNANKHQTSQALIIQTYANSVNEQPMVNFSGKKKLFKYEQEINTGLQTAQAHANNYLNVIQPAIIANISNIGNYYALHDSVATALPAGSTEAQWTQVLTALQSQSKVYHTEFNTVVTKLETLRTSFSKDSAQFTKVVTKLNAAVNGDHGVLKSIRSQLSTIQDQIDGVIAGQALSGLGIDGTVFLTAVGAVTDSTPLVVGGVALVETGLSEVIPPTAFTLESLNKEKAKLLTETVNLKAEVALAAGIEIGYQSLHNQVAGAVKAATGMISAWESLSADLGSMISDLNKGITTPGILQTLFLTAANTTVKTVIADISMIKHQMACVHTIVAKKGQTVGQAIVAAAEGKHTTAFLFKVSPKVMNLMSSDFKQAPGASSSTSVKPVSLFANSQLGAGRGTLSKSVANLRHAGDQVRSVGNLPSAAQRIQSELLANTSRMIPQIYGMQTSVGHFVKNALPQLDQIQKMLKSNEVLEKIAPLIENVRAESSNLDATANQVLAAIQELTSTMFGYFNELYQVEVDLTNQMTGLRGALGNAHSRESAAKEKYYYLLALIPLMVFGLPAAIAAVAVALALWNSIKSEVDGYENQINSLNSQISSLNNMKTDTKQLGTDFRDVISKVTSVKNAVSFVSNDVLNIVSEIDTKEARIAIEIEVSTAIAEVKTLSVDALGSVV